MSAGHGLQGHAIPEHVYAGTGPLLWLRRLYPEFKGCDDDTLAVLVRREVTAAFEAGRVARRQPRWTVRGGSTQRGARRKGKEGFMYVWTHTEQRCYVVFRGTRYSTGKTQVRVVSILTNSSERSNA